MVSLGPWVGSTDSIVATAWRGRNGPAAGLKRRGAVSLWMWNPEGERGKKEGRERGNGSHRSGRMMGEQSGMPRHPSQKTGERERLLPPVAAAAAPACVLLLGEAAAWRFSFRVSCASELRLEAAQARRQCRSAATATISESAVESHSVRPMS